MNMLNYEYVALLQKYAELKMEVRELIEKLKLAEQGKDEAWKQVVVLGKQLKAGPIDTVKGSRTNSTVVLDESVNPRLGKILEKVVVNRELVVALANSDVKDVLETWFTNVKRGVYLIIWLLLWMKISLIFVSQTVFLSTKEIQISALTKKRSPKTSSTEKNYCMWKSGSLNEDTISLFLFGNAYQRNPDEKASAILALFNCNVRKDSTVRNLQMCPSYCFLLLEELSPRTEPVNYNSKVTLKR
ncbi:hypothetical protein BT93_A0071 [Corymbia citriodora subsp. variegata]|nr:hypothetical protein BT93_A0071 [Corymbia citriodora subsp. variegata]